jgi:hypothetical protein
MRAVLRLLPLALVAALCAAPADGSVVRRMNVEDLTRTCAVAVEGSVVERTVRMESGRIWTKYSVRVTSKLVGSAADDVSVHVPGGRIGNLSQHVHGTASMKTGEQVVLFLWKDSGERLQVLGQSQGAFHVERDAKSGRLVCRNRVDDLVLVDRGARRVAKKSVRLTLDSLRARVKAELERVEQRRKAEAAARRKRLAARKRAAERNAERLRGRPGSTAE